MAARAPEPSLPEPPERFRVVGSVLHDDGREILAGPALELRIFAAALNLLAPPDFETRAFQLRCLIQATRGCSFAPFGRGVAGRDDPR